MRRLYLSIIFVVTAALLALSWGLDKLVVANASNQADLEEQIYFQIIEGMQAQLGETEFETLAAHAQQLAQHFNLPIQLEHIDNIALPASLRSELSQTGGLLLASDRSPYLLRQIDNHPEWVLNIALPMSEDDSHSLDMVFTIALYLGISLIMVAWLLPLTRRLYQLNQVASKIGAGEIDARVNKSRLSYIPHFERSFNAMAEKIEKLMADNKILARSLSHDIRTPIACLRFGLEAAQDTKDPEKLQAYLARMDGELTNMEHMTEAFLEYASIERHSFSLRKESINLMTFMQSVSHDFALYASKHNIKVSLNSPQHDLTITADYHWFYRAAQNLLTNAIDHAKQALHITISSNEHHILIDFEDDGPGIPADKRKEIFSPFTRLSNERGRQHGHFGLGLAISMKVVEWHQGTIIVTQAKVLGGAKITISLPKTVS